MKPDPLDALIRAYADQPSAQAPDDLLIRVQREIERRRGRSAWREFLLPLSWREILWDPRFTLAALACAFAVGIFPAISLNKAHTQQRFARQSLHLEVFGLGGPGQLNSSLNDRFEAPRFTRP